MGAKLAGGGGGKRGALPVNAEPNVIPFIDVMLVLLIIFMVAAPVSTIDLEVDMPDASLQPVKRPPKPVFVSVKDVNEDGEPEAFVMNEKQPTAWGDLRGPGPIAEAVEREILKSNPRFRTLEDIAGNEQASEGLRVYIRAEGTLPYKHVLRVFNELQYGRLNRVALVVDDRAAFDRAGGE